MTEGKSIVFAAGIALVLAGWSYHSGLAVTSPVSGEELNAQATRSTTIDAHKPVAYYFAITNTTDKAQTVDSVRTSCACLKVSVGSRVPRDRDADTRDACPYQTDAINCVPPGGVLPFEVVFNPAGMEGHVEKTVAVTLAPSGGTQVLKVAADVRLRLGFKPMDAAFGVIRRSDTGREIEAKLSGYVAGDAKLGTPYVEDASPTNSLRFCASALKDQSTVFNVQFGADGKSVVAKFRDQNVLPGVYSETWTIPTSDKEIPEIKFVVSARVADVVSVTPQVITVGWDEPVCSRMVMVRTVGSRVPRDRSMRILSAETKPRKWGDVKITQRPLNGWRIDIENIDPREVRQFSKRPFLEVKTNLSGMESFEIPFRVVQSGGAE